MVGDSIFTETGQYSVMLESVEGCDSLVQVELTILDSLLQTWKRPFVLVTV
jgi:hypothetical protein